MQPEQEYEQPQKQAKQTNIIRKTTIEALQPIINRIEQHIAYLLTQSSNLRIKSDLLEKTVADHSVITSSIAAISQKLHEHELRLDENRKQQIQQKTQIQTELVTLGVDIEKLEIDLKSKQTRISDLFAKNTENSRKVENTKEKFLEIVEKYAEQVDSLQAENRRLASKLKSSDEIARTKIQNLEYKIKERDASYQATDEKIELYLREREQLRDLISRAWERMNKAVDIQRYERDWRIIRIENEAMRKDNQEMIDRALTPQVRQYLPQMIERMSELRKVNALQQIFKQHKQKTDSVEHRHNEQFAYLHQQLAKSLHQIQKLQHQSSQLQQKYLIQQSFNEKFQQGSDDTTQKLLQIRALIQQKQRFLKQKIDNLVQARRQEIYREVVAQIPEEEKDFFKAMKEFLPLLQKTKQQILERCEEINKFGQSLEGKLEVFNNKIVKIKGDVSMEIATLNKKNKFYQTLIQQIQKNLGEIGKVLSSYCELFLLIFCLSFNSMESEVYVTYSDGIVYEHNLNEDNITYRKVTTSKETIKRSALATIIKMTDQLICKEELSFLEVKNNKPSDFFKLIKQGLSFTALGQKLSKGPEMKKPNSRQNRLPSLQLNISKTIETSRHPEEPFSQTLKSDFRSTKMKDKSARGRYSNLQ